MRSPIGKICLWLAASDFTRSELTQFAEWFEDQGRSRFVQKITKLREQSFLLEDQGSREVLKKPPKTLEGIGKQVERLLIHEARFSKGEAARALRNELLHSGEPDVELPVLRNETFAEYVRKLERIVNASVILHIATKLRNQSTHGPTSDWPLKR